MPSASRRTSRIGYCRAAAGKMSVRCPHAADRRARQRALTTFRDLGVLPPIADALANVGIAEPFPIQAMTIPVALTGADVVGQARTGTGKTYAFAIPLLQRIAAPNDRDYATVVEAGKPQALVITPTRELALQVTGDLETASTVRRVRIVTVYGGRGYETQVDPLRAGVDVVVGTPGRILDLVQQDELDLGHVKVLVLDEADEMLDLGFLPDVERIIGYTPELRQTMLFSATMPRDVVTLARRYLRHPVNVHAEPSTEARTVPTTAQFVYQAHALDKDELLARVLQAEGRGLAMVFCRTKRQSQKVADELSRRGFAAAAVHGDLNQAVREQALRAFRTGKVDVLVATDVAGRGIDVDGVTHVINYTCPDDETTYLHRIGRTGRAGASGVAITLVDWEDVPRWRLINKALELPYDTPPETYSTSEHLYHDLGIASSATGVLPRAQRTRAGLAAEPIEDLDQKRGRRERHDGRGQRRDRSRGKRDATRAKSDDGEGSPQQRRARTRQRTRRGIPVNGGSHGAASETPS
jgi:superfamily II DNA/RNA helicase